MVPIISCNFNLDFASSTSALVFAFLPASTSIPAPLMQGSSDSVKVTIFRALVALYSSVIDEKGNLSLEDLEYMQSVEKFFGIPIHFLSDIVIFF